MKILNRFDGTVIFEAEAVNTAALVAAAQAAGKILRSANLRYADLSYADLSSANLSYADLRSANLSSADLRYADLRYANLSSANLRYADLRYADLRSADLSYADLSSANLSYADLRSANLSSADLPYAPKIPDLDKKIWEAINAGGKLKMDNWHTCQTTHCRGGWAIVMAGEAGKVLENIFGEPLIAATLIYHASTGKVPDFFASNEDALADIKKCAGVA
jgi:Pentapeptide repeats (8 copies)